MKVSNLGKFHPLHGWPVVGSSPLRLLFILLESPRPLSFREMAQRMGGRSPNAIALLVKTLVRHGLVKRGEWNKARTVVPACRWEVLSDA